MFKSFDEIKQAVDNGESVVFATQFEVRHFSNGYFVVHKATGMTCGTIECHDLGSFERGKAKVEKTIKASTLLNAMGIPVTHM